MLRRLVLLSLLALSTASAAFAQDRFALVIGNGDYRGASKLNNPANDAVAVAAALEKLNFNVTRKIDAELTTMEDAVASFRKSLTKDSVALFFYAGHGLQVKGENFLLPVDAEVKEESQVRRKCFPVDELLGELEASSAALKVVILDSCRDNPLTRSFNRSAGEGLASIANIPDGTIIAFSTSPGKAALDAAPGVRGNSPYTAQLVAALDRRPAGGLEITRALKDASKAVKQLTGQVPWMNQDATIDDFYLWNESFASVTPKIVPPTKPAVKKPTPARSLQPVAHPSGTSIPTFENSIGMKFVIVPAGQFQMGSPDSDPDAEDDEKPLHRVKLARNFHLGVYEVTLGQFLKFYHGAKHQTDAEKDGKGGWGFDTATRSVKQSLQFVPWSTGFDQTMDHPVVNVSWNDAQAFCQWLSEKEGLKYRLPTEAEWEFACRAGTTTRYYTGDDIDGPNIISNNVEGDRFKNSAPVGSFRANRLGLYDMHGNVLEWCDDWYRRDAYASRGALTTNPKTDVDEREFKVARGGGWSFHYVYDRAANRTRSAPSDRNDALGFRVVLDLSN